MRTTQIVSRETFLKKAREHNTDIKCLRTITAIPTGDGPVVFVPAMNLDYEFSFSSDEGLQRWTHREVIRAESNGLIGLDGSLWALLEKEDRSRMVLVQRSGAI
jgi:hypothetical protein